MKKQTRNDLLALSAEVIKLQRQLEASITLAKRANLGELGLQTIYIGLSALTNSIQNIATREEAS